MGHANNSRFLTYCESARIAYWEAATGEPIALVTHGARGVADPRRHPRLVPVARVLRRGADGGVAHRPGRADVVHAGAPADGRRLGGRRGPASSRPPRACRCCTTTPRGRPRPIPDAGRDAPRGLRGRAARSADRPASSPRRRREAAEDRDRVLASEPEAVDRDRPDRHLPRALFRAARNRGRTPGSGVWRFAVGGMTPSRMGAEGRERGRDPGCADEMTDHRLRRADRHLVTRGRRTPP